MTRRRPRTILSILSIVALGLGACGCSPRTAPSPDPAGPSGGRLAPLSAGPAAAASPTAFQVRVARVRPDASLLLEDGRTLRLQGLELPDTVVRPEGMEQRLRQAVERLSQAANGRFWVNSDGADPAGVTDLVGTLRASHDAGVTVNEELLRQGLAVFSCRTATVTRRAELFAAAAAAQAKRLGWFGCGAARSLDRVEFLNGAVLGLHHQSEDRDYHRQLDELQQAGFRHVCLLFSVFLDRVDSVQIRRDHIRTVRDARLIETIGYARRHGMSVMLLPIVLLLDAGEDDWRGVLRPKDMARWWLNYDRFLSHYLDIAEAGGVDLVSVGSELGSLEDQTATWKRVILNARGRYRGLLTYSANWDHGDVAEFFPALDLVGMSAYFALTKKTDPSVAELVVEWRRVATHLAELSRRHGRPLILTELGYASQQGINRNPWNYVMDQEHIDLQEQADCFEAFRRVAPEMKFLSGAYFYDYYDEGGATDWSYSPRGKPAMEQWRAWAKGR